MRDFSNIAVKIARIADRQFGHVTREQLHRVLATAAPSKLISLLLQGSGAGALGAAEGEEVGHAGQRLEGRAGRGVDALALGCGQRGDRGVIGM